MMRGASETLLQGVAGHAKLSHMMRRFPPGVKVTAPVDPRSGHPFSPIFTGLTGPLGGIYFLPAEGVSSGGSL